MAALGASIVFGASIVWSFARGGAEVAIQLISVGLSIMESLRNPARWLRNEPGLLNVISRERPDEVLSRAGIDRDLAGASAWLAAACPPKPGMALVTPSCCGRSRPDSGSWC
jgi:hypothetical protein